MKRLCQSLKERQIKTSVYHSQTEGLIKRFNQTLKYMLRKVVDVDGKNWDQLQPHIIFSIRKVPKAVAAPDKFLRGGNCCDDG